MTPIKSSERIHPDQDVGEVALPHRFMLHGFAPFGLAKLTYEYYRVPEVAGASALPTAGPTEEMLTSPGAAVGTIAYMSPEQAQGEPRAGRDGTAGILCLDGSLYVLEDARVVMFRWNAQPPITEGDSNDEFWV